MAWSALETLDLGQVVPEEFAPYRPVLRDALWHFVGSLAPEHQLAIWERQQTLPADTSVPVRLVTLLHQCPSLHKLGQILSRDRRLGGSLRRHLQTLESLEPQTPLAEIRRSVEQELGPGTDVVLGDRALAEGSVAVVIPFETKDGTESGVLKVLRPGVEDRLGHELERLGPLADFVADRCKHYGVDVLDVRDSLESVRQLLAHEVDLEGERKNLVEAAANLAVPGRIVVPKPLRWGRSRVLSLERLYGHRVTDVSGLDGPARRRVAGSLVQALLSRPWTSLAAHSIFHADPHPGNLLLLEDGRIGLIDWSLVGRLGKVDRGHFMTILLGALMHDPARIVSGLVGLSQCPPLLSLADPVQRALQRLRGGQLGLTWVTALLDDVVTAGRVRLEPSMLLWYKTLFTLRGVLHDVGGEGVLDVAFSSDLVATLLAEWPRRLLSNPLSADLFGSHLSTRDVCAAWLESPAAGARFVLGLLGDAQASLGLGTVGRDVALGPS